MSQIIYDVIIPVKRTATTKHNNPQARLSDICYLLTKNDPNMLLIRWQTGATRDTNADSAVKKGLQSWKQYKVKNTNTSLNL